MAKALKKPSSPECEAVEWKLGYKYDTPKNGKKFNWARGVTATQTGEIAVADYLNNQVVICSNKGEQKGTIDLESGPEAVAAIRNPEQRLFVLEERSKYVKVFNMNNNTLVTQFPTMLKDQVDKTEMNLRSLAVNNSTCTILVGDVKRMVWTEHKPTDGEILRTIPVQTPPYHLAVDDKNRVVVSGDDTNELVVHNSQNEPIWTITPTINCKPVVYCQGVCCDSSGIYLVVNQGVNDTSHIHHFDKDGMFLDCLAQDLHDPCGITFTSNGQLAVADRDSIKIYHKV